MLLLNEATSANERAAMLLFDQSDEMKSHPCL